MKMKNIDALILRFLHTHNGPASAKTITQAVLGSSKKQEEVGIRYHISQAQRKNLILKAGHQYGLTNQSKYWPNAVLKNADGTEIKGWAIIMSDADVRFFPEKQK